MLLNKPVVMSEAAEQTLAIHRMALRDAGLETAWERLIALVVWLVVEFDHNSVIDYDAAKATHLQMFLQEHPESVMEAHSSDYQRPQAYAELIRDGFAILKVGPALTFVLSEKVYALAAIEREVVPVDKRSHLTETVKAVMLAHPADWQKIRLRGCRTATAAPRLQSQRTPKLLLEVFRN